MSELKTQVTQEDHKCAFSLDTQIHSISILIRSKMVTTLVNSNENSQHKSIPRN